MYIPIFHDSWYLGVAKLSYYQGLIFNENLMGKPKNVNNFFYLPITALFFLKNFIFILKLYIYFSSFARRTSKARDFSSKPGSHFVRAMREWVFEKC